MIIEKTIYDYLSGALDVDVYAGEPEEKTAPYVYFRVIDYSEENYISKASVYVESVGESVLKAANLNEEVVDAMRNLISLDRISASKISGGGQFFDTAQKQYRFQTVCNIVY